MYAASFVLPYLYLGLAICGIGVLIFGSMCLTRALRGNRRKREYRDTALTLHRSRLLDPEEVRWLRQYGVLPRKG